MRVPIRVARGVPLQVYFKGSYKVTAAMQIIVLLRWPPRDVSPGAFFAGSIRGSSVKLKHLQLLTAALKQSKKTLKP